MRHYQSREHIANSIAALYQRKQELFKLLEENNVPPHMYQHMPVWWIEENLLQMIISAKRLDAMQASLSQTMLFMHAAGPTEK